MSWGTELWVSIIFTASANNNFIVSHINGLFNGLRYVSIVACTRERNGRHNYDYL